MGFWGWLFAYVFSWAVGELLRPKPEFDTPKPASLGDFTFPTANDGRAVPVVFGTAMISGPNILWYGDLRVYPIKKRVRTGASSKEDVTIGYKYYLGMQLGLCHGPIDALLEFRVQDKVAWTGNLAAGQTTVSAYYLFGGEEREGGLGGTMRLWAGYTTQGGDDYIASRTGAGIAYRGIATLVFQGFYVGTTPNMRPWSFVVRRLPQALGSGYHDINGDANPAELLYEVLTDATWGLGLPAAKIDTASFQSAAATLYSENFGLSGVIDNRRSIEDIVREILRHIDGVMYLDPTTGQWVLRLARADYDPATLPVFDQSNILELGDYARGAWDETVNEVRVGYTDRGGGYQGATAIAQDIANWNIQGGIVSSTVQYPYCHTADLAARLASRELRALSYPLARCRLRVNRQAYTIAPGDVFRLSWAPLGITDMVMRVTRVNYGNLTDGTIELDAVQDVFSLGSSLYAAVPPTGWYDPSTDPAPCPNEAVLEAPYFAGKEFSTVYQIIVTLAERPTDDAYQYDVITRQGTDPFVVRGQTTAFTPTGTLVSDYPASTAAIDMSGTLVVAAGKDLELLADEASTDVRAFGRNFFYLDDEILAFETVTDNGDGTYTLNGVWRGLLDTVPQDHSAGARVWFGYYGEGTTEDTYAEGDTVDVKLLPSTTRGTLDASLAAQLSLTFTARALRPYPPGNVTVNGSMWPAAVTGVPTLSWSHRDRKTQDTLVAQDEPDIGPEAGVTYNVDVFASTLPGQAMTLRRQYTGLSGTSLAYDEATETTDGGPFAELRFEIESQRSTYTSRQRQVRQFNLAGWGRQYGNYYGGV